MSVSMMGYHCICMISCEVISCVCTCIQCLHHSLFCIFFLLLRNNTHILGKDNSNVPRILVIIAEAVAMGALEEDASVLQRLLAIVRHVQVLPANIQCTAYSAFCCMFKLLSELLKHVHVQYHIYSETYLMDTYGPA